MSDKHYPSGMTADELWRSNGKLLATLADVRANLNKHVRSLMNLADSARFGHSSNEKVSRGIDDIASGLAESVLAPYRCKHGCERDQLMDKLMRLDAEFQQVFGALRDPLLKPVRSRPEGLVPGVHDDRENAPVLGGVGMPEASPGQTARNTAGPDESNFAHTEVTKKDDTNG